MENPNINRNQANWDNLIHILLLWPNGIKCILIDYSEANGEERECVNR